MRSYTNVCIVNLKLCVLQRIMPLLEMDFALGLRVWLMPYKALSSKLNHVTHPTLFG